jgi:ribosomal protein L21E
MVKRSKGAFNGRTRKLKGKSAVTVAQMVRTFNVGDKVTVNPKARWEGMPHLRYSGRQGTIVEARGKSYVVEVRDYSTKKRIIAGPVHLTKTS